MKEISDSDGPDSENAIGGMPETISSEETVVMTSEERVKQTIVEAISRHAVYLRAIARRYRRSPEDQDDILQILAVKALNHTKKVSEIPDDASLKNWLALLVSHAAQDYVRHESRRPTEPLEYAGPEGGPIDVPDHRIPSPIQNLETKEICSGVRRAVYNLPHVQKWTTITVDLDGVGRTDAAVIAEKTSMQFQPN